MEQYLNAVESRNKVTKAKGNIYIDQRKTPANIKICHENKNFLTQFT